MVVTLTYTCFITARLCLQDCFISVLFLLGLSQQVPAHVPISYRCGHVISVFTPGARSCPSLSGFQRTCTCLSTSMYVALDKSVC